MTSLETAQSRPEFESVDLDVGIEAAHRTIEDTIKGLSTAESEEGRLYRTADGMLVAIVGKRGSGSGDVKASLAYRTEPASELATRKAKRIRDALSPHAIDR